MRIARPKFSHDPNPTFNDKLAWLEVLGTSCERHDARPGEPCWRVPRALCWSRIRQRFTGEPSTASLRGRKPKPEHDRHPGRWSQVAADIKVPVQRRAENSPDPDIYRRHVNRQGLKRPKGAPQR